MYAFHYIYSVYLFVCIRVNGSACLMFALGYFNRVSALDGRKAVDSIACTYYIRKAARIKFFPHR